MEPRTEYINGILHVVYDDGEAIPLADVMKFNYPDMDFDLATGAATGPMPPPRADAPQATTGPTYKLGDVGRSAGNENLSAAYDALGSAMQPGTYDPIRAVNNYVGNMGAAGLLGVIGAGEKLGGYAADALGAGYEALGGDRWQPGGAAGALYGDMAAGVQAAGVGPEARMLDAMGLLGVGRSVRDAAKTTARGFLVDETGALRFSNALPEPRTEAEAIAKTILELRATGNVDAVTERMMDAADPQYMYAYTPLPMDEASRMARAREIGYGKDRYHGNNADVAGFRGSVFSSDNPTVASTYNRGMLDAQIYPIMTREGPMGSVTVEGAGSNWNQLEPEMIGDIAVARGSALYPNEVTGKLSTRGIEKAAKFEGKSGVTFKDIKDLGPGFNSQQFKNLGYTPEQEAAIRQQYLTELSKPSEVDVRLSPNLVRSRFARFDPMFSHLRNLSAGVAPFGLLALPSNKEQK